MDVKRACESLLRGLPRGAENTRDGAPGRVVLPGAGDCGCQLFAGREEVRVGVDEQGDGGHGGVG